LGSLTTVVTRPVEFTVVLAITTVSFERVGVGIGEAVVTSVSFKWVGVGAGATVVKAWPPPQAQHMSEAVKSASLYSSADSHHEGVDA
jgi:hypothetical protein